MKGRKPKPAAVRALHGSRTRPHHRDDPTILDAAAAETVAIAAPRGLTPAERVYWCQFATLLATARVLTPADVETLADYCRACVAIDEVGQRRRTALHKKTLDQPLVRLLDASMRGWIERKTKLAGELGLTAIARTRVAWSGHAQTIDTTQKPQSKLAELQQQAAAMRRPVGVR
jgi:phage terminase small subunit